MIITRSGAPNTKTHELIHGPDGLILYCHPPDVGFSFIVGFWRYWA